MNSSKMTLNYHQNSLFSFYTIQLVQLLNYNGQCQGDFAARNAAASIKNSRLASEILPYISSDGVTAFRCARTEGEKIYISFIN